MNGSSPTGRCSNVTTSNDTIFCSDPGSSVLFDNPGGMPMLTGLDDDMWASQLLTAKLETNRTEIVFDFRDSFFVGTERVEIVMFNCPEWEMEVQTIRLEKN